MRTNALGQELQSCCQNPMTGFYRDGYCRTGPDDNPVEIIGDGIKDRMANTLRPTIESLAEAPGEELRPIYENAERVRRLVSHNWLINQVNASGAQNSAISC